MKLAGISEVADLLGMSRQGAHQHVERPDFPQPIDRIAAGPVWDHAEVKRYAGHYLRTKGKKKK